MCVALPAAQLEDSAPAQVEQARTVGR
jgi:hypothetical protein